MIKKPRIAIIGAGVAGLSLAILATQQGCKVDVFERGERVSSLGAGVTLWPNALFVLNKMGLTAPLREKAGLPGFMRQYDASGSLLNTLDLTQVNSLSGFDSLTILRRDLMAILANKLEELGRVIQFNRNMSLDDIHSLEQTYDLVVGADGRMKSVVREFLFEPKVMPQYQGFINIIGTSELSPDILENSIQDYRGQCERFGIVPVTANTCYWAAGWKVSFDQNRSLSSWYEEMHHRFESWPKPVKAVLTSFNKATLNRIFVHDIEPLKYWHQGKILIIGDAAHAPLPTSGQGACQALEDVWHLMVSLEKYESLEDALSAFYQVRIHKASATQSIGRQLAQDIFMGTNHVSTPANISAKQLSAFWMQGLGSHDLS